MHSQGGLPPEFAHLFASGMGGGMRGGGGADLFGDLLGGGMMGGPGVSFSFSSMGPGGRTSFTSSGGGPRQRRGNVAASD